MSLPPLSIHLPRGKALVRRAREFALHAHTNLNQRRKYTGEPYILHPMRVAGLVGQYTDDAEMLAAAWLHDVIEDTPYTFEDLNQTFGPTVAVLVSGLSDVSRPEDGNRKARKALDREHLAIGCARVHTVKLADLIDNIESITAHDRGFARRYLAEKALLLPVLKRGHEGLQRWAAASLEQASNDLGL